MLPTLNDAEYKLLERYIAEQRIDELLTHGKFSMPDKPSDFYNQKLICDRIATLKKEAD